MESKEKVGRAIRHESGPIPIDLGSNAVTGIHASVVAELRKHYGLEDHPVKINEPYQMLGEVEPDLQDAIGVDVAGIYPYKTMFGFTNDGWKEWRAPWGQELLVPKNFVTSIDDNGDVLVYPEGDRDAPPSGRMPTNGFFFDTIIRQEPLDDDKLNVEDNLEEFGPITEVELAYYEAEAKRLEKTGRAVMANFGGTGLGDIALVTAPFAKRPKGIRDVTEWYVSTVARQDYLHEIFRRQTDIALKNLERVHNVVGEIPDVVFLCGTDFGTQESTFCSPDTFTELYAPYYKKMTDWIHTNTSWKVFKHSCGAVAGFMPFFIEAGFDVINPVQISAKGMEREHLKREFGDDLVFWGGGVDTQKTLAFGSAKEVKADVTESCRVFGQGGGFVFNAVHNVQAKSSTDNVVSMIEAVREFNRG